MKSKFSKIILTYSILILISIVLIAGYVSYSKNYNQIFGLPYIKNEVLDLENVNLQTKKVPIRLSGEWKFYYNKWIVSDNEQNLQDAETINLPTKWTGKTYNNQTLTSSGFASYSLLVKNPSVGDKLIVCNNFCDIAFRAFINNQLCFQTGLVSKDINQTHTTGDYDFSEAFEVTTTDDLQIVIEVSANNYGGLYKEPMLASEDLFNLWNSISFDSNFLSYLVFGIFIVLITLFSACVSVFKKRQFGLLSLAFLISLFLQFLSTIDAYSIVCRLFPIFKFSHLYTFSALTALIYFVIMLITFLKQTIHNKKNTLICAIIILINIVFILLFLFNFGAQLSYLFLFPSAISLLFYLYYFALEIVNKKPFAVTKTSIYLISIYMIFIQFADNTGFYEVGARTVYDYMCLILIALIFNFVISSLKNINQEILLKEDLENKINSIKNQKLKYQIISGALQKNCEIKIYTFSQFTIFVDDIPMQFKSAKSKELLALLIDRQGGSLSMEEVIVNLYPDKDLDLAKKSYRDNIIKLKNSLLEYGIRDLINVERAKISLNKNIISYCDYWDFLSNPNQNIIIDDYMLSYDWSIDRLGYLQNLLNKK